MCAPTTSGSSSFTQLSYFQSAFSSPPVGIYLKRIYRYILRHYHMVGFNWQGMLPVIIEIVRRNLWFLFTWNRSLLRLPCSKSKENQTVFLLFGKNLKHLFVHWSIFYKSCIILCHRAKRRNIIAIFFIRSFSSFSRRRAERRLVLPFFLH